MTQPFTFEELAKCAERETKQRVRVYNRRVEQGYMTRTMADKEIAMMVEIARHFRDKAKSETLI